VTGLQITVRQAVDDDAESLSFLEALAIADLRDARGGQAHVLVDGSGWSLASRRHQPDAVVFAALIDDAVIGYAVVSFRKLDGGDAAGRIEAIYVEAEAREVGVGEELLNAAIAWCRERSCVLLDAVALPGDRHTKNFFETFGMVARAIVVSRRLDRP
jgi:GNAT superfamily N-acetyltransferase